MRFTPVPDEDKVEVTPDRSCPLHRKKHVLVITREQFAHADRDDLFDAPVQARFPFLSADQREILLSGNCQKSWDHYFGKDT